MLQGIYIKNFALLEEANLDMENGVSALIGESGSGKSLFLDALSSLLGGRCSVSNIREGKDRYSLQANFKIPENSRVSRWLEEKGFPVTGEDLVVGRELSREGKSRVFIQESLASLSLLKELGTHLAEIHNQNEQMFLLDKSNQLEFLDRYSSINDLSEEMQSAFLLYRNLKKKLDDSEKRSENRNARLETLRYQIAEWEELQPKPNEWEELNQEEKILAQGEKLSEHFRNILYQLEEGEHSVLESLGLILSSSQKIAAINPHFESINQELHQIYESLKEIKNSTREEEEEVFFSPDRLDGVQSRLRELNRIQKKYGMTLEEIAEESIAWRKEWEELEGANESVDSMRKDFQSSLENIKNLALAISRKRRAGITGFEDAIQKELEALGMKGSRLQVVLRWEESPQGDVKEGEKSYVLGPHGLDQAEYYFSANPGEKPRPLRKIASGGEMSRIMLAIRSALGQNYSSSRLLVFDEIDSGISGDAAVSMAERLKKLGEHSQILLITHSQSIAAIANRHIKVEKKEKNGRTVSEIQNISMEEAPLELAKMVTGKNVTESALEHAKEILWKKAG